MLTSWRAPAHAIAFFLALAVGTGASAQAGRRLGNPATHDRAALGRALDAPRERARTSSLDWAFDLSATTSLPLSVGAEAMVQSPLGLTAHLSLGHTPNAYLGMVASMLRDAGVYGPSEQPLVGEAIAGGAWNVRAGVGFTLIEGLELGLGYTYLAGGASLSPNAIEAAVGHPVRWPGMTVVPLDVEVHALHARVGWRFVIDERFVGRVAIGWTHAIAASAEVEVPPEYDPEGGPADQMEEGIERALGSYGFTPELIVSAGYRF